MIFKEGDIIVVLESCSGCIAGEKCRLTKRIINNGSPRTLWALPIDRDSKNVCGCSCSFNWKLFVDVKNARWLK